jgi:hypothetical protein
VGITDGYRYWLDPQRDFIVMRCDLVMRGEGGKENVIESDTIEETARSPQGVWYATKVRRRFPRSAGIAPQSDQVYHLYIDFKPDLPDSLVEAPKPGRIH